MSHQRNLARLARTGAPTVDTAQELRDLVIYGSDYPKVVQTLGAEITTDGGGGLWQWDETSTDTDNTGTVLAPTAGGTGRWLRVVDGEVGVRKVSWFGIRQAAAISQAKIDNLFLGTTEPYTKIIFSPGKYVINGTIDLTAAPDATTFVAEGCRFTCLNDEIAFKTNTLFNAATDPNDNNVKRRWTWTGGYFDNQAATRTVSVAFQMRAMREVLLQRVYFQNFFRSIDLNYKDTYTISKCQFYNNVNAIYTPQLIKLTDPMSTGSKLLNVNIDDCLFGGMSSRVQRFIHIADTVADIWITKGSFNGEASIGHIVIDDQAVSENNIISITDCHFEQISATGPAIHVETPTQNTRGFSVTRSSVQSALENVTFMRLNGMNYGKISCIFRDGSPGANSIGTVFGDDIEDVTVGNYIQQFTRMDHWNCHTVTSTATWSNIRGESPTYFLNPAYFVPSWQSKLVSTGTGSINLYDANIIASAILWPMPPKAVTATLIVQDSGSAAATDCVARLYASSGGVRSGLSVDLRGAANSSEKTETATIICSPDGQLSYSWTTTGTDSMIVTIILQAVHF